MADYYDTHEQYMQKKEMLDSSDAVPRRQNGGTPEQAIDTTHRMNIHPDEYVHENESVPSEIPYGGGTLHRKPLRTNSSWGSERLDKR